MHVWGLCVTTSPYKYAPLLVCVRGGEGGGGGGDGMYRPYDKFLVWPVKIKVKFDRTFISNARTPMYINYSRVCCVILQYMHRILP